MQIYQFCGLPVAISLPVPANASDAAGDVCCRVTAASQLPLPSSDQLWSHDLRTPGGLEPWRIVRYARQFRLSLPEIVEFSVSLDGSAVQACAAELASVSTLGHLICSQALPMALAQQGRVLLHASSIVAASGAIVILGASGAGKSTLAAYLGTRGFRVLSEDVLRLTAEEGRIMGHPEYSEFRLWPEAVSALFPDGDPPQSEAVAPYTSKRRVRANGLTTVQAHDRPAEIGTIVCLAPTPAETDPRMRRLGSAEAFQRLADALFRLDLRDPVLAKREFKFIADLLAKKPVYELEVPRSFSHLPRTASLLVETAGHSA